MVKGIAAVLIAVLLLAAQANAKPVRTAFLVDPGIIAKTLQGPRTVVITGNPFRVPWQAAVNQQVIPGTGFTTLPTQFSTPFAPPGPAGPGPTPAPAPTAAPGGIVVKLLTTSQTVGTSTAKCKSTATFKAFTDCLSDLQRGVDLVIGSGGSVQNTSYGRAAKSVTDAQLEFIALQGRTDQVLTDNAANLVSDSTADGAKRQLQCLIGTRTNPPTCPSGTATVDSVNLSISQIIAYPAQEVADEQSFLDELKGARKSVTAESVATDINDVPKDKKPTDPEVKAAQLKLDNVDNGLANIESRLRPFLAGGAKATDYDAAVTQLHTLQTTTLAHVSLARFYAVVDEDCAGVYGGGRTTLITVTRTDNQSNSVAVVCPSRAFVSEGFAFSGLPQHDFSTIPTNNALPSAPSGSATPAPAVIAETTFSDIRPQPVVFLNVRLSAEETGDNGLYASFGLSVNSSPQNVTLDYLGGFSYALSRSLIGTVGVTLAPTTALAPGYSLGDPASQPNLKPPTITRYRSAIFIAITYGAH